jgi:hypothetical protein
VTDLIFDEHGNRAQKLTLGHFAGQALRGWVSLGMTGTHVLGFDPERSWRPSFAAVRMAKGWRVYPLDCGVHEYLDMHQLSNIWQGASPEHKRLPTVAAVEMWIRHVGVHQ